MGALVSLQTHHPDPQICSAAAALDLGVEAVEGETKLVAIVDTTQGRIKIS